MYMCEKRKSIFEIYSKKRSLIDVMQSLIYVCIVYMYCDWYEFYEETDFLRFNFEKHA